MSERIKLLPCKCGGKAKIERFCGWWHCQCSKCGRQTNEPMGCTTVWGYNTRNEMAEAWNREVTA